MSVSLSGVARMRKKTRVSEYDCHCSVTILSLVLLLVLSLWCHLFCYLSCHYLVTCLVSCPVTAVHCS